MQDRTTGFSDERSAVEPPIDTSSANRTRLSGPGLRTFNVIADRWGLAEAQRIGLLGDPSRDEYENWMSAAEAHTEVTLSSETLLRISATLGIYKALRTLFTHEADEISWLTHAHDAPVFSSGPPLSLILTGEIDNLLAVRRYLDAWLSGQPASGSANDEFEEVNPEDIVFL